MSRCMPQARVRSNTSRRFTSKNGKCELTKIVWSERLRTSTSAVRRPALMEIGPSPKRISPGAISPPPSGPPGSRGRGGPDRPLHVKHAHAVAEEAFDLDGADQLGHAVEDLGGGDRGLGRLHDRLVRGA